MTVHMPHIVVNFRHCCQLLPLPVLLFLLQKAQAKELARQEKKADQEVNKAEKEKAAKELKAARAEAKQVPVGALPVDACWCLSIRSCL